MDYNKAIESVCFKFGHAVTEYAGWSDERTLTTPVRKKGKKYMKGGEE